MAVGMPGSLTICARQRFSATQVTSMTKDRPAIVRSKLCRTYFKILESGDEEQQEFYPPRETKQAKRSTKVRVISPGSRFAGNLAERKNINPLLHRKRT